MAGAVRFILIPLWFFVLFLPFGGFRNAAILFGALLILLPLWQYLSGYRSRFSAICLSRMPGVTRDVLLIPVFLVILAVPLAARDYIVDIAILTG
ncbi:MAG: hypothetical protein ACM34I_00555, partial [bacterium]